MDSAEQRADAGARSSGQLQPPTPSLQDPSASAQPPPEDRDRYSLTNEEVAAIINKALGYQAVAPRTVSWWCQQQILDCGKFESGEGKSLRWFATRKSVDDRIKALKMRGNADARSSAQMHPGLPARNSGQLHADADNEDMMTFLKEQIAKKDTQIEIKDKQITDLIARSKETNILMRGMQQLLGLPDPDREQRGDGDKSRGDNDAPRVE